MVSFNKSKSSYLTCTIGMIKTNHNKYCQLLKFILFLVIEI